MPDTATVDSPALMDTAQAPAGSGPLVLELAVRRYQPPERGGAEGVVSVQLAGGDRWVEVGRFAVFPNAPFTAGTPEQERRFAFPLLDLPGAADGTVRRVQVRLLPSPQDSAVRGAAMTFAPPRLVPAP